MKPARHNIAFISTFPPTQCGIATYVQDLTHYLSLNCPTWNISKIPIRTSTSSVVENKCKIEYENKDDYYNACDYINATNINIVDIQHEYKIYGKPDGDHISILLNNINKPICTTLHSVFGPSNDHRERILTDIIKRSDLLFVFSKKAKSLIVNRYRKRSSNVLIIPHGTPPIQFKKPIEIPLRTPIDASIVFASAGHMRNTKGYEVALKALWKIKRLGFKFHYLILGSNHPENVTSQSYRDNLVYLTKELNLSEEVSFINEYLERTQLIQYLQAADICLLPYTREEQSSSGILALMMACGRPVVSTPFQFATSYICTSSGVLSDSFDELSFEQSIIKMLNKKNLWDKMSIYNHQLGKNWSWENISNSYCLGYKKILQYKLQNHY